MARALLWVSILAALGAATAEGADEFPHFWNAWEFLAAASAASYNTFALLMFVLPRARFGALDDVVKSGWKIIVGLFRFGIPIFLFALIAVRLLPGQRVLLLDWDLGERLQWTMLAFISMLIGDAITRSRLRSVVSAASPERLVAWREELLTLIMFVHLPFILSYVALLLVYWQHHQTTDGLVLEAFVAGAATFEVIVQNTIHAVAHLRNS